MLSTVILIYFIFLGFIAVLMTQHKIVNKSDLVTRVLGYIFLIASVTVVNCVVFYRLGVIK